MEIKIDGDAEARIRWTLKLLADKVVELGILNSISEHGGEFRLLPGRLGKGFAVVPP